MEEMEPVKLGYLNTGDYFNHLVPSALGRVYSRDGVYKINAVSKEIWYCEKNGITHMFDRDTLVERVKVEQTLVNHK